MKPLNSKQLKLLQEHVKDYYGFTGEFQYVVFSNEEDKYYVATREVEGYLDRSMRIERIGVYFGQDVHGELRLSIEGSQMIGPHATKHVITLTPEQRADWMLGKDIVIEEEHPQKFHIVRCGEDFLGCGKFKNGLLHNYVPKERYVGAVFTDDDIKF
jgi:NOL1/NOP2/fmu family ribosome biogenesis protein